MSRTVAIVIALLLIGAAVADYFRSTTFPVSGSPVAAAADESRPDALNSRPAPPTGRSQPPGAGGNVAPLNAEAAIAGDSRHAPGNRRPAGPASSVTIGNQADRPQPLPVETAMALEDNARRTTPAPGPGPGPAVTDRGLAGPGISSVPAAVQDLGRLAPPGTGVSFEDDADSGFIGPGPSQLDLGLPGPGEN